VFSILIGNISVLLRIILDRNWFFAVFNLWLSFTYLILTITFWWCVQQLRPHIADMDRALATDSASRKFRSFIILLVVGTLWSLVAIILQVQISVVWLGRREEIFFRPLSETWRPDYFSYLQCVFVLLFAYYAWIPYSCCEKSVKIKPLEKRNPGDYGGLERNNRSELSGNSQFEKDSSGFFQDGAPESRKPSVFSDHFKISGRQSAASIPLLADKNVSPSDFDRSPLPRSPSTNQTSSSYVLSSAPLISTSSSSSSTSSTSSTS